MKQKLIITLFATLFAIITFAQNTIVARIQPRMLNLDLINDKSISSASFEDILNSRGLKLLDSLDVNLRKLNCVKMFPDITTEDKYSISRLGKKVPMPPFWATISIDLPKKDGFWKYFHLFDNYKELFIFVDPPLEVILHSIPDDSLFQIEQLSLLNPEVPAADINVVPAWGIETGKRHIKVGVFDTGIDHSHPDIDVLTGVALVQTEYFDDAGNTFSEYGWDTRGHGTPVAGIIGAKRNNQIGISGIAGGDGHDTSGVSILDFKTKSSYTSSKGNWISVGLINAARSIGTYHYWDSYGNGVPGGMIGENAYYWNNSPGFGVHVTNHSYGLRVLSEGRDVDEKDLPIDDSVFIDDNPLLIPKCHLCRESYLFSNQNGVLNVVSRGNQRGLGNLTGFVPSKYWDSWLLNVGASNVDGSRLEFGHVFIGDSVYYQNWQSPIGENIDVIAPGSPGNVVSLRSQQKGYPNVDSALKYQRFGGTSSSAPHVSGVAALLASYYNKPCYSNRNLDPADIEYIIQKSATHVNNNVPEGEYDDSTGWGRLDAYEALKMIQFPEHQIVHPQDPPINVQYETDTISLRVDEPLYSEAIGPLSSNFSLTNNRNYRAERVKVTLTYDFSQYISPTTDLLDLWLRNSETNSLRMIQDTTIGYTYTGFPIVLLDTLTLERTAQIENIDGNQVTFSGYYYHFIGEYQDNEIVFGYDQITEPRDFWYPKNPMNGARMAYSIYIRDTVHPNFHDFPCDSLNPLLDPEAGLSELTDQQQLKVFPVPVNQQVSVEIPLGINEGELYFYNNNGQLIYEIDIEPNQRVYHLSVEHLSKGVYFVSLKGNHLTLSPQKWVKL